MIERRPSTDLADEIEELDENIERLADELKRFGTPSAGGDQPVAARQRFIRLFNERWRLKRRRQELEDELLAACDTEDAYDVDAELGRPYEDDGDAHG
jgi:hypothetical protein